MTVPGSYQKINSSLDISPVGKDKPGFIGRKTTTYRNVIVNDTSVTQELNKNKILEEIITLPQAMEKQKNSGPAPVMSL